MIPKAIEQRGEHAGSHWFDSRQNTPGVLIEINLRVFNYGRNDEQWIKITETKQMLNPDVAGRYFFNTEDLPQSNNDAFDIVKRENAFRIFVMGGSSAQGFPFSPNGTFSRYIRDRFELVYPDKYIEVINLGITATNSYTIRDLIPGVLEQRPDLILIYAGHNEYYGAFGVGSTENIGNSREFVNFLIWLNKFKSVEMLRNVDKGLEHHAMGKKVVLATTDLFVGVCVSPFKQVESELMAQYYKLKKKIEAGAKFIITQIGYDARKYHELLQWLRVNRFDIPVLVNVDILPYPTAKMMNSNKIPGCVVTDKLVSELGEEAKAPDKGKATRLLRAAKLYAIAKGMGYAGAHNGGHGISPDMVEYIITKGEELSKDWEKLIPELCCP